MEIIVAPWSFRPEVFVENRWQTNALRFGTYAEALAVAQGMNERWSLASAARARPSHELPNRVLTPEGELLALPVRAIPASLSGPLEPATLPDIL